MVILSLIRLLVFFFPQQRKLMGSSAQISSGVCRCGSQEQVPEEGSGRFRRVPKSSGVCWCRFRRRVPEGSREFRCKMVKVPEASSGRFRRVPVYAGVGSGGRFRKVPKGWFQNVSEGSGGFWRVTAPFGVGSGGRVRKVPESSGVVCCLATLTGAAM